MMLDSQSIRNLLAVCKTETDHFHTAKSVNTAPCLILFRRAIVDKEQGAWEAIHTAYAPQVERWVRSELKRNDPQLIGSLVNHTFARFWQTVTAEKFITRLNHLGRVLQYLKMCAMSSAFDQLRLEKKAKHELALDTYEATLHSPTSQTEAIVSRQSSAEDIWQNVWRLLNNDDERIVAEMAFHYELTPAQIFSAYTERFGTVKRVYRIQENILRRLRRQLTLPIEEFSESQRL